MAPRALEELMGRIGGLSALDTVARPLSKKVAALIPHGAVKDTLSGTWLGHPVHPMLTDLPIGCWTNAMALDLLGGKKSRRAARFLVGLGILTAVPTAAAGVSDWSDYVGEERRIGLVHAAGNTVALLLYFLSWKARRGGKHWRGVLLGLLGGGAATASAYLGGHLSWRKGVNVDRHAWDHPSDDWIDVAALDDLDEDKPMAVSAGDDTVLLVRGRHAVQAISDVCGHAGGPLHEGSYDDGCIQCPWHGSVFRVVDGAVVHGPATGPQPAYEVRVAAGRVSVRRT